jgi:hypothetical protein
MALDWFRGSGLNQFTALSIERKLPPPP